MHRFKSARYLQRFVSTHDQVVNLFIHSRYDRDGGRQAGGSHVRRHGRVMLVDAAPVAVSRPRRSKLTVPVDRRSPALTELA
jgi:hypothetical protein